MDRIIELTISKSIERVFQSWFCEKSERLSIIEKTFIELSKIYEALNEHKELLALKASEVMKATVGLDYGKVYLYGRKVSSYTIEEAVHDSLAYFLADVKENSLIYRI